MKSRFIIHLLCLPCLDSWVLHQIDTSPSKKDPEVSTEFMLMADSNFDGCSETKKSRGEFAFLIGKSLVVTVS
jgi:hypothetical protein